MMEEETVRETQNESSVKTPPDPPKVVREAEHKLKEMSRKAKERQHEATRRQRGTAHNASKQKALSEKNYFWLVIGGLGALGVGYLVFGKGDTDRREPPKPRQRFKFVPRASGAEGAAVRLTPPPAPKTPEKVLLKEDKEKSDFVASHSKNAVSMPSAPKFELNCF